MLSGRSHTDKILGDLAKCASVRPDAGPEQRRTLNDRINHLLESLWAALPSWRQDELRREL